jgi:hypothetical protein
MVGALGFEPRNTRIKIAELTTCRRPNIVCEQITQEYHIFCKNCKGDLHPRELVIRFRRVLRTRLLRCQNLDAQRHVLFREDKPLKWLFPS